MRGWRLLVVLATLAATVEIVSWAGWSAWRVGVNRMEAEPEAGARALAESWWLGIPSAVHASRRLGGAVLDGVPADTRAALLDRIGRLQQRWMPTDPTGPRNRALAALARGETEAAMEFVRAAVQRWPVSPYLVRLQALLTLGRGDYDGCLELLARAEGLAPGYAVPPVEVLPGDDDWIRLEGLRRRAALYPRLRERALLDMARELRRRGEADAAERALGQVGDAPDAVLLRALWALEDGDAAGAAAAALEQARRTALPASIRARAWSLASRALAASGDDRGALEAAEAALRLAPDSPAPYLALAAIAERKGELDRALEYARRAWGVAPADVGVLLTVSRIAARAGRDADARLALRRAVEVAPDQPDLRARLAALLLRQGRYMEAAMTLSRALDRFPADARLLALAGRLESETTGGGGRPEGG